MGKGNMTTGGRLTVIVAAGLIIFTGACSRSSSTPHGTSSGGGGFGDENSTDLLNTAKGLTASAIRQSNPQLFTQLPNGWTQERIAQLIENIHSEPNAPVYRYNRELMFDHRIPDHGEPYLVATNLFFRSHSAIAVNSAETSEIEPHLKEIRMWLLHEVGHVLGIGQSEATNYKARVFALNIVGVLNKNNVVCSSLNVPDNYQGRVSDEMLTAESKAYIKRALQGLNLEPDEGSIGLELEKEKAAPYRWFLNRSNGFGLQTFKEAHLNDIRNASGPWLGAMMNGQPQPYYRFVYHFLLENHNDYIYYPIERLFTPPFLIYGSVARKDDLMSTQYYGKFSQKDEGLVGFGGSLTFPRIHNTCTYSEEIVIPRANHGNFKGSIEFKYDCPQDPLNGYTYKDDSGKVGRGGHLPDDNGDGRIDVDCVESFPPPGELIPAELFGEGPLTSAELIKYHDSIGKLL